MGWVLLLVIVGVLVGFFVGERSYPSHDEMREAAAALVPDGSHSVAVYENDGWEPLAGRYEARATYEGGGRDRTHHLDVVIARAAELGWEVDEPIDHPGALEIRIRRQPIHGTISLPLPPAGDLNGRVWIAYDDGVVARPWLGAVVGGVVGALSWVPISRRTRRSGADPSLETSRFT